MKLLQAKLAQYQEPQKAKALGIYPYFREIESEQDTEVYMHGKKVLMFGSNCYTGLVNDKRVHEAAIKAIQNTAQAVPALHSLMVRLTFTRNLNADWLISLVRKTQWFTPPVLV